MLGVLLGIFGVLLVFEFVLLFFLVLDLDLLDWFFGVIVGFDFLLLFLVFVVLFILFELFLFWLLWELEGGLFDVNDLY